jgi:hypothetical protein
VNTDIQHVNPLLILAVIPSYVGSRASGLHDNRNPMQLRMPWVKDMT